MKGRGGRREGLRVVGLEEGNEGKENWMGRNFGWERNLGKIRGVNSDICLLLKNKQKVVA
jgi:hypothetical protein